MIINVLLTGAGGLLAHFILKALKASTLQLRIVGCDHSPDAAGLLQTHVGYVVPSAREDNYLTEIIEVCRKEYIQLILVHGMVERHVLAEKKDLIFEQTGAVVVTPPSDVLRRLEDKWELTRFLGNAGFNYPRSVLPTDRTGFAEFIREVRFPYIVKDRFGWGSRGIGIARNKDELEHLTTSIPNPVIQEYLNRDDEEYTVGVFVEPGGKAAASIVMKRELGFGLTMKAEVIPDSEIGEYCKKVVEGSGCLGPTNVQLRMAERGPVIFEINARFSTTTSARCHYGYNEAEMCARSFVLGEKIQQPAIREGRFVRVIEDMYVDQHAMALLQKEGRIDNSRHLSGESDGSGQ